MFTRGEGVATKVLSVGTLNKQYYNTNIYYNRNKQTHSEISVTLTVGIIYSDVILKSTKMNIAWTVNSSYIHYIP